MSGKCLGCVYEGEGGGGGEAGERHEERHEEGGRGDAPSLVALLAEATLPRHFLDTS